MSNGLIDPPAASRTATGIPVGETNGEKAPPLLPRSASYTKLEPHEKPQILQPRNDSIRRSYSENVLANTFEKLERRPSSKNLSSNILKPRRSVKRKDSTKRRSAQSDLNSETPIASFAVGADDASETSAWDPNSAKHAPTPDRQWMRRSISGSISKIARRSWLSTSRSPSPSPNRRLSRQDKYGGEDRTRSSSRSQSTSRPKTPENEAENSATNGHTNGMSRRNSLLRRKSRRPLSAILGKDAAADAPSVPAIPKSFSTDKIPSLNHKRSMLGGIPAVPRSSSLERLQGMGVETPRKKDELWGAFRSLDGDFHKFQARPSTTKTAVVRSTLLPFLRTYAEHPSTLNLRPEDLDRRTVILNKWWTALLEMLNGRHGESVSGNDRPAVLEAVTALMVRPEWILPPSFVPGHPARNARAALKSRSTTSLGSNMSEFLVDSVFHNVKNTFTQNLLAQMAYVVDKMSARNVAASVVTFCGKATAYAFFYCEGVAEILVRLWKLSSKTLRRVLTENGVEGNVIPDAAFEKILSPFPSCLYSLGFRALRPMVKHLRAHPHVPIATAYIPWQGPWTGRWAGRDTDLFFVFVKFYMDLACRLLPETTSREERVAAPGWVLVHAQILTVLDATIQRGITQPPADPLSRPSSVTFDEMLGEADAAATMLPLPNNGLVRSMAENRLIMLLRDCLSGSTIMGESAQVIFAESFSILLRATARQTSLFDHDACFTLCDFLEEAMAILLRYYSASGSPLALLDWAFWFDVYKRMLESHNIMTDVRLLSFVYGMWGLITNDEERKREICLDWLLAKDTFERHFNHWCPMVRAFFMRLLIWRVARIDGGASEGNVAILETLYSRLWDTWCHFVYLQQQAEQHGLVPPSTAPCSPAPCRCLLIIRDDVQPAPSGMFLSFEGILSSSSTKKVNPYEKHSSPDPFAQNAPFSSTASSSPTSNSGKKRWGLLKSIMPFSSTAMESPAGPTVPTPQPRSDSHPRLSGRPESRNGSSLVQAQPRQSNSNTQANQYRPPAATHRSLSFKYSLEWMDKENSAVGREMRLHPPKLPLPAQLSLGSRSVDIIASEPRKTEGSDFESSKYAGRALAEWAVLIMECQRFFERRKAEGVPTYQLVETPTLGVDPFRKM